MYGYGMYNSQLNIEKIDNQMRELENLKRNYQNSQNQPIQNIINTNTAQIDFEARLLSENEKPDEILVQRKTAFIDLINGKLTIKELNGNMKSFDLVLPKTKEQIRIEELEKQNKELMSRLEERERKNK